MHYEIDIYKNKDGDSAINFFHGRSGVNAREVVIKNRNGYKYAEPNKQGVWAFGGNILFSSNGVFKEFTTPIKLHDRNLNLER